LRKSGDFRVFFPIAKSKDEFERSGSGAQKFLEGLPKLDRGLMEHLKPYQGGNDALWALHHLDIVRKHRRLLNARLNPIHMSIEGTLAEGDFTPLGGRFYPSGSRDSAWNDKEGRASTCRTHHVLRRHRRRRLCREKARRCGFGETGQRRDLHHQAIL
jgi:hypothetical protein